MGKCQVLLSATGALDDLLAPTTLHTSTAVLALAGKKKKTLEAPLAQRAQERMDREAACERAKEVVDKWEPALRRIREVSGFGCLCFWGGVDVWASLGRQSI
jgi:U3 small nucleolar RNA-associated protein 14